MIKVNSQVDFLTNEENQFAFSSKDETAIAVLEQTEVLYNENSGCNLDYCKEHNIKVYKGKINTMGAGVVAKGSMFLTVKRKLKNNNKALSDRFAEALCQYLINKGLPSVRCDNNDIMVDNGKVASGGEIILNGFQYMGYQISINQDYDAIKNACVEPSTKIPKALSDFGITTDEMVKFCEDYWTKN